MIAIYHRVYRRENFEKAAKDLIGLLYSAQEQMPNEPRALYVDIDGHRNDVGGYDADMQELQVEFGIEVLLQYVTELHFPLTSVVNSGVQKNDVPEKIVLGNARNDRDDSLDKIYIENYSNTEIMSEKDVYLFMEHVSEFLKDYNEATCWSNEKVGYDVCGFLRMWHKHIKELIIELFNSFVYGNLISVAAMTRTLIECYIYLRIIRKEKSQVLLDEWWLCNTIHKIKDAELTDVTAAKKSIKEFCRMRGIVFEEKWEYYTKHAKYEKGWLKELLRDNGMGVKALCNYIGEAEVHRDYESANEYVHGQDITTKQNPFTFYCSIYSKLYIMIDYMFRTMRLFEVDEEFEKRMVELEGELIQLGDKYLK